MRLWFQVHSFTGVITGLLLFFICWTGAFATISNEIDWLVTPEARVEMGAERATWGRLLSAVEAAFPVERVHVLDAPLYERSAAEVLIDLPKQKFLRVYVDPYTAEVQGAYSAVNVQRFFRDLHRRLFIPGALGIYVVSVFSLTILLSLVAALLFYKRWWRRFFQLRRSSARQFWSELHKVAGLWSLWFLLLMSITGIWYGIEATRLLPAPEDPQPVATREEAAVVPLDALIETAQAQWPALRIERVIPPGGRYGAALYIEGRAGHVLVRDRINHLVLDAHDGTVVTRRSASEAGVFERWIDTADPLHFGDFGGLVSKIVWFLFGLLLSGLCLTGAYLHAQRLAREADRPSRSRWPGTAAACAVSLLVIAASVPLGLQRLRFAGPLSDGVRRFPDLAPGVEVAILAWIAGTLLILGAWVLILLRPRMIIRPERSRLNGRRAAAGS